MNVLFKELTDKEIENIPYEDYIEKNKEYKTKNNLRLIQSKFPIFHYNFQDVLYVLFKQVYPYKAIGFNLKQYIQIDNLYIFLPINSGIVIIKDDNEFNRIVSEINKLKNLSNGTK